MNILSWKGTPINELTREELIEVINYCGDEIKKLREDRNRWFEAGDPIKYLMSKKEYAPKEKSK